ncbi:MAG: hypothetical protein ACMG6H_00055 [Acidobacteriota bacterium]
MQALSQLSYTPNTAAYYMKLRAPWQCQLLEGDALSRADEVGLWYFVLKTVCVGCAFPQRFSNREKRCRMGRVSEIYRPLQVVPD